MDDFAAGVGKVGVETADFIAANFAAISARFWAMRASAVIWEELIGASETDHDE